MRWNAGAWTSYLTRNLKTRGKLPFREWVWPGHALHALQAVDDTRRVEASRLWIVHRDDDHLILPIFDLVVVLIVTWLMLRLTTSMKFFSFTIAKKSPMF